MIPRLLEHISTSLELSGLLRRRTTSTSTTTMPPRPTPEPVCHGRFSSWCESSSDVEDTASGKIQAHALHFPPRGEQMRNRALCLVAVFLFCCSLLAADGGYTVIKKIPIAGTGSWDYLTVDAAARRLYVSHGAQVEIVDIDSLTPVGTIPKTPGVHGIALVPELGRGFISNGQSSTVTIFDLKTLKAIAEVSTGQKPDAIIYDPATSRVFAFNGGSNSSTAIDAANGKVAGTVELGGGPEFAAADGKGYVFNNLEDESQLLKINSRELKVEQRWPTAPCSSPSSMAMDLQ